MNIQSRKQKKIYFFKIPISQQNLILLICKKEKTPNENVVLCCNVHVIMLLIAIFLIEFYRYEWALMFVENLETIDDV